MSLVVRAFPLVSPVEDLRAFAAALSTDRKADTVAFYRRFGVSHESWHLQETPKGKWVIGITVLDNPEEAAPRYAQSSEEFDSWFKAQVRQVSGVNLNEQPLGPPTSQIYAWSDELHPNTARLA